MTTKTNAKTQTANKPANKAITVAEYIRRIHEGFEAVYGADEQLTAWADIKAHSTEAIEGTCYEMRDAGLTVPAKRAGNSDGAKPNLRDELFTAMPEGWSIGHRQNILSMIASVINGKRDKFAKNWTAGKDNKKEKGAPTTSMVAIPKSADDMDAANLLLKLFEKMQQDTTKTQREFAMHMVTLMADAGYEADEADEADEE